MKDIILVFIVGAIAIGASVGIVIALISGSMTYEKIIVEGDVVDVIAYDDYMEVFMDDGESYNIRYPGDNIDLTKGSTIIMRLTDNDWFWIDDGIWDTVSITKIPEST